MAAGWVGRSSIALGDADERTGPAFLSSSFSYGTYIGCGGHEGDDGTHLDFNNPNHSASTARSG